MGGILRLRADVLKDHKAANSAMTMRYDPGMFSTFCSALRAGPFNALSRSPVLLAMSGALTQPP